MRRFKDDLGRGDELQLLPGEEAQPGQGGDRLQDFGPDAVHRSFQPEPVCRLRLLRVSTNTDKYVN